MFCHLCSVTDHCVLHDLVKFCDLLNTQHYVNVFFVSKVMGFHLGLIPTVAHYVIIWPLLLL